MVHLRLALHSLDFVRLSFGVWCHKGEEYSRIGDEKVQEMDWRQTGSRKLFEKVRSSYSSTEVSGDKNSKERTLSRRY